MATNLISELGLAQWPAVLFHSSFKGVRGTFDSPLATVAGLVAAAPETTMLFPTFSFDEQHGPQNPPSMDVASTPSCVGAIPDASRAVPGGRRSLHPTHSVLAIGPEATTWAAGHETGASPCDQASPFQRLVDARGAIVLLGGVTHDSNTTLHWLEELLGVPYHLQPEPTVGVVHTASGDVEVCNRLHQWGWDRDFDRVEPVLLEAGAQRNIEVDGATARIIDAHGLAEVLRPIVTSDPLFLLTADARERFEAGRAPDSSGPFGEHFSG